LNKSEEKMS